MEAILDDDAREVATTISGYVAKSSSNEAPGTYVSKPWHHKKLTLKMILILNYYHVADCLYHQDSYLILFVIVLLF